MSRSSRTLPLQRSGESRWSLARKKFIKWRFYYLLITPALLYFLIFHYAPMAGILIAFKDISPFGGLQGVIDGPWVGLKHFTRFFNSFFFWNVMRNTLEISVLKIIFGFPAPIIFALMLNEVTRTVAKRVVQTISYLPHFISWVVVTGLITALLASNSGLLTGLLNSLTGESWSFLTNPDHFRGILVSSHVWKTVGWSSIIYLAAIAGIDPHLYEAAAIDGASRLQMARHITLPGISFVIVILFIFEVGHILEAGFEQILLLYSPAVYGVSDILDTYVYREGLIRLQYSFAAAVGLFKAIVSLILIIGANSLARRLGQPGIW
ncbi:MAG: ABC transporter permease subunit [Anaerolineaceae bacterium]|nr:ABC transporter permease subunit [Anaerolineaceae bacterium]